MPIPYAPTARPLTRRDHQDAQALVGLFEPREQGSVQSLLALLLNGGLPHRAIAVAHGTVAALHGRFLSRLAGEGFVLEDCRCATEGPDFASGAFTIRQRIEPDLRPGFAAMTTHFGRSPSLAWLYRRDTLETLSSHPWLAEFSRAAGCQNTDDVEDVVKHLASNGGAVGLLDDRKFRALVLELITPTKQTDELGRIVKPHQPGTSEWAEILDDAITTAEVSFRD